MKWESERKLLDAFRDFTAAEGSYVQHPECFGFDLVIVDEEDSERIGIEAKNGDAIAALNQCLRKRKIGDVNAVAILVPHCSQSVLALCLDQGVGVVTPNGHPDIHGDVRFRMQMPMPEKIGEHRSKKAKPLPRHVSNRAAGVPSPKALTPTREKELRLCGIIRKRGGFCTAKDVQRCGLVRAQWRPTWIRFTGGVYKLVDGITPPDIDVDFADVAEKYAMEVC